MQDLSFAIAKKQQKYERKQTHQLVPTDKNKFLLPTDTNWYENDHLFEQLSDLVNQQYRAWYMKLFYKLGKDKVLKLASVARADAKSNPRGYFSKLLKTEANNIS